MTTTPRKPTAKNPRSAKPADIRTNRWEPELPILDRVLPLNPPAGREPAVTERSGETTDSEDGGLGSVKTVRINEQPLVYDTPAGPRHWRRKLMTVLLPVVTAGLAAGSLLVPPPAGAQTDPEVDVKSVRFDLDADGPGAQYRSIVVVGEAGEQRLTPMAGVVRVTIDDDDANAMSSVVAGSVSGAGAEGFASSVASAATSRDVSGFVRLGRDSSGGPASFKLFFDRPLGPGDHVLVQEANGDGIVEIAAVDAAGTQTGNPVVVSPPYELNTGHGIDGSTAWASVVSVKRLGNGGAIAGIRVSAADSEVKAVALVTIPAPAPEDGPGVLQAAGEQGAAQGAVGQAVIGLAAGVQPAIAVDGSGCVSSGSAPVSVGQAVTFCYAVTNLGSTNLSQFRFTDAQLGLTDAALPLAAGGDTLAPGQEAVFYHHSVAGAKTDQVKAMVTAQVVDEDGTPLTEFGSSSSASTETVVAEAETTVEVEAGGEIELTEFVETPSVIAIDETPAAPATNDAPAAAPTTAPTQLAMTGMPTEPWILVILAMGLIFIGYTALSAFSPKPPRRDPTGRPSSGHNQLDALGFE